MTTALLRTIALVAVALLATANACAEDLRETCPPRTASDYFFPKGLLDDRSDLDAFVRKWYSKQLRAMSEPSLSCGEIKPTESYRFTWLRTFHRPIAVRVSYLNAEANLVALEMSGAGGYDPGRVAKRIQKRVSIDQWNQLRAAVEKADVWAMPTRVKDGGFDGSQWIIECRRGRSYHLTDRWSPGGGPYRDAALVFLQLAGWSVPEDEMY